MSYKIIWEYKGVTKQLFGQVTSSDLMAESSIIQGDIRFDDLKFIIVDFHECAGHNVSDPSLLEIAAIDEAANLNNRMYGYRPTKIAIVSTDVVITALAKQYSNYVFNSVQYKVCPNVVAARLWIGKV